VERAGVAIGSAVATKLSGDGGSGSPNPFRDLPDIKPLLFQIGDLNPIFLG